METIEKPKIKIVEPNIIIPRMEYINISGILSEYFKLNGVKYQATREFLNEMSSHMLAFKHIFAERKISKQVFTDSVADEEIPEYVAYELKMKEYLLWCGDILHIIFHLTSLQPNGEDGHLVTRPGGLHNIMGFNNADSERPVIIALWLEQSHTWHLSASYFRPKSGPYHLKDEVLFLPNYPKND